MSTFLGLHTGLTGVRAGQRGLDTASHNVANANTPGYTRQRTIQSSRVPWHSGSGPIGTGVDVTGVQRLRDSFLDTRVRSIGTTYASADTTAALLQRVEDVLGEPDNGVTSLLGEVFDAFEDLALIPEDTAARQQVVAKLDAMASRFNAVAAGWDQLAVDTGERLDLAIGDANTTLARISEINRAVAGFGGSDAPNDLLDERDALADELSRSLGASASTNAANMMSVTLDGQTLVTGGPPSTSEQLQRAGTTIQVVSSATTVTTGGEIGALNDFIVTGLPAIRADFDAVADDVRTTLNAQHAAGQDLGGAPGGPLLSGAGAGGIALTAGLAPADLAAAAPGGGLHDGRNAQALADLREGAMDDAARGFAVGLGQLVANATTVADAEEALLVGATVARQSAHSVSLDEEMVSMVQFQRALEASARVMTAVDEALNTLINRTGVVGR